jgi:hypothetical protein
MWVLGFISRETGVSLTRNKRSSSSRARRGALAGAAAAMLMAVAGASSAQAAPVFHCEASALRATLLGTQTVEPIVQGRSGDCANGNATPSVSLPSLVNASALYANTTFDGTGGTGSASGGVAHLDVLPAPEVLAAARQQVVDAIDALPLSPITVPGLPRLPIPGLPSITGVTIDLKATLKGLIPAAIPSLLAADVLNAQANVACSGGGAVFSGASNVIGLKVLGQDLGADSVINTVLPLINSQSISLSSLDLSKIAFYDPTGVTPIAFGLLNKLVLDQAKVALAALPPITIPAALATVSITPNEQTTDGSSLTQRALHANITLGGQPVLDAVLGEAKVSAANATCAPAAAPVAAQGAVVKAPAVAGQSVADQILSCSDRKLVLVDVLKQGGKVKLLGAANKAYVGKKVAIRLRATGNVVAHATVQKDGSFETTAPMPAQAYFASNKKANSVRYRAEIGKELSLPLKLQRRLIVNSLTSKDGKVTISGRVVRPLTTPVATIRLVRRVSCHKVVLVKRFKPDADGTFKVTVKAPAGQAAAIYRMATSVREKASNPRSYPTFTLPRGVALNTR